MRLCKRTTFLISWCLVHLSLGCSGDSKPVSVSGRVLWEDGKPVASASVRFVPTAGGREASGYTSKEGDFYLSTFAQGDGALQGEYIVVITKTFSLEGSSTPASGKQSPEEAMKLMKAAALATKEKKKVENPVPVIYSNEKNSPLKWKVEGSTTNVVLKLKKV